MEITGISLSQVQQSMEDFKDLNKEIFSTFIVKFDWRDFSREVRKKEFDYNGVVNRLVSLFDPED